MKAVDRANKILSVLLFIVWGLINFYLVASTKFFMLGGSATLYYLIPILLLLLYKYERYRNILFQLLILCTGFIALNLLSFYFQKIQLKMPLLFGVSLAFLPFFLLIIPPFLMLVNLLFKSLREIADENDRKYISNVLAVNNLIPFAFLSVGATLIFIWTDGKIVKVTEGIYILLGSAIYSVLFLIIIWRKVKDEEISYFLTSIKWEPLPDQKVQRYIVICFIALSLLSFPFEASRGMWLFWVGCLILLQFMFMFLWRFYKQLFKGESAAATIKPENFELPNLKNFRIFALYLFGFVVSIFWLLIIKQLLAR